MAPQFRLRILTRALDTCALECDDDVIGRLDQGAVLVLGPVAGHGAVDPHGPDQPRTQPQRRMQAGAHRPFEHRLEQAQGLVIPGEVRAH